MLHANVLVENYKAFVLYFVQRVCSGLIAPTYVCAFIYILQGSILLTDTFYNVRWVKVLSQQITVAVVMHW